MAYPSRIDHDPPTRSRLQYDTIASCSIAELPGRYLVAGSTGTRRRVRRLPRRPLRTKSL
eukprot:3467115-Ditylum_brightwellii.AAC.1